MSGDKGTAHMIELRYSHDTSSYAVLPVVKSPSTIFPNNRITVYDTKYQMGNLTHTFILD